MKYADLFKYNSHFSSARGDDGNYNANTYNARISHRKKKSNNFKIYLAILFCLVIAFLYIRYQVFYNEESLFYRFYHEVFQFEKKEKKKGTVSILVEKYLIGKKPKQTKKTKPKTSLHRRQKVPFYLIESNVKKGVITMAPEKVSFVPSSKKNYVYDLINKLIQYQQKNNNYFNSFNENTILLNYKMEQDTLLLNFNSQFEYNRLGDKGIDLQIQQILWTIFKSPFGIKVKYISFLFNDRRKRIIGGHGFELKPFYSRKDLKKNLVFQ